MSEGISTQSYLIRAIHEWCADSGYSPYISALEGGCLGIPSEFFQDGKIVLNISYQATTNLLITNEVICFLTRFNGIPTKVEIKIEAVDAIFSKESGQGLTFIPETNKMVNSKEMDDSKESSLPQGEQASVVGSNRDKSAFLRIVK